MVNGNKISGHTENSFLSRPVFQGSGQRRCLTAGSKICFPAVNFPMAGGI